jgi:hypothetical protein
VRAGIGEMLVLLLLLVLQTILSLLSLTAMGFGTNAFSIKNIFELSVSIQGAVCTKTFLRRDVTIVSRILQK